MTKVKKKDSKEIRTNFTSRNNIEYRRIINRRSYYKRIAYETAEAKQMRLAHRRERRRNKLRVETVKQREKRLSAKRVSEKRRRERAKERRIREETTVEGCEGESVSNRVRPAVKVRTVDTGEGGEGESVSNRVRPAAKVRTVDTGEGGEGKKVVNSAEKVRDSERKTTRVPHYMKNQYLARLYSLHLVQRGYRPKTFSSYLNSMVYPGVSTSSTRFAAHRSDIKRGSSDSLKCDLGNLMWTPDYELICVEGEWKDCSCSRSSEKRLFKEARRDEQAMLHYMFVTRECQLWNTNTGGGVITRESCDDGLQVLKKMFELNETRIHYLVGYCRDDSKNVNRNAAYVKKRKEVLLKSLLFRAARVAEELSLSKEDTLRMMTDSIETGMGVCTPGVSSSVGPSDVVIDSAPSAYSTATVGGGGQSYANHHYTNQYTHHYGSYMSQLASTSSSVLYSVPPQPHPHSLPPPPPSSGGYMRVLQHPQESTMQSQQQEMQQQSEQQQQQMAAVAAGMGEALNGPIQGQSSGDGPPLDRIVFAAPSGGANEYSNLSSAGSISDREQPETPGRASNSRPVPEKKSVRKRRKGDDCTPRAEKKITVFIRSSPKRSRVGSNASMFANGDNGVGGGIEEGNHNHGESSSDGPPLDRIVFAAPSGGANEYSNLSSAGSISDREQPKKVMPKPIKENSGLLRMRNERAKQRLKKMKNRNK